MQLCDWTSLIQTVLLSLASILAIFGIDAWRREHVGKRRMELAEEVLALFFQARDVIRGIRSPLGFSGEGTTRKPGPGESPEEKEVLDGAYVAIERYNKHLELFGRIYALRYRFMAQIGIAESKPFDELKDVIHDIIHAARCLERYWRTEGRQFRSEEEREAFCSRVREAEAIFWEGEDPDPIQPRVDALMTEIERTCRGILSSKGTLFGLINLPLRWRRRG